MFGLSELTAKPRAFPVPRLYREAGDLPQHGRPQVVLRGEIGDRSFDLLVIFVDYWSLEFDYCRLA